ncbi:hypothetical protein Tel_10710 [Candidatus Tenderia electrophaga]|jgi:hypothetical protein|uniref:Inner membrane protein YgaP-like transmembrane domain-containing protein n=1 Tax=Candidatus Tenderia electrophaga TaxID=1748243 RepID=A0A0S2TEK2_9GAMM|nr:hypothetical protein Tel_10710 [Candidatus Tenderia electrophaga]
MNTDRLHFDLNQNMANSDKVARYALGAVLIASIFVVAPAYTSSVVLLPLIAIPIVISAIIGWDPVYALFQKSPIPKLLAFNMLKPATE